MFSRKPPPRLLTLLSAIAMSSAVPVRACSVPVFRYALEHWPPDAYQAVVFQRGPLSETQQGWVRELGADGLAGRLHANLAPRIVDLDADPDPEWLELARQSEMPTLPWLVVRVPRAVRTAATVWAGPLSGEIAEQLLDSPARREIVERLTQGQSAVWVLLESGDRAQDAATAQLLESRLAELANTLSLPALDPSDIVNGLISVAQKDLRLDFSVLRLSRSDAAEQPFIRGLLGTEPGLAETKEPMAFPIFGRGRALHAFVGAGIKRETIDQAASFLIGKCSCQVKELNPGADLLFAADWDGLVKASASAPPDLPTLAELAKSAPETVTFHGSEAASGTQSSFRGSGWVLVTGSIAAALVAAGTFLRARR